MRHIHTLIASALLLLLPGINAHAQEDRGERVDSVFLRPFVINQNSFYNPEMYPMVLPAIRCGSSSGILGTWHDLNFTASGSYFEHPFLISSNGASFGISGNVGHLYYNAAVSSDIYKPMETPSFVQFGFSGIARYQFTSNLSVSAFAQLYNMNPAFSAAAYPFVNTSRFGGYVTYMGDKAGIDVGVQRYFDPMRGGWQTAPIVTPKFKIGDNVTISLPVGGLIKNAVDGPMQGPPPPPSPNKQHRR